MAGADSVTAQLFIARDGEPLSERFEGQVLTVEAKRIACISSTHIAMLNVVGEAGRLAGVSGKSISPIPGSRRTTTVSAASVTKGTSTMSAAFVRPGPRQLYGVNGTNSMEDKLKELDIPFLYVTDYLEESPLGKAESLLTLSEVIGKRVGCQTISNYLFVLMNSPPCYTLEEDY